MSGGRIVREKGPRIKHIGSIRCGKKVTKMVDGREISHPQSMDYFIPDGPYAERFTQKFPAPCRQILIVFPSSDVSEVCNEEYQCRDADGRLAGYGDGKSFHIWHFTNFAKKEGEYRLEEYANPVMDVEDLSPEHKKLGKWSVVLTLRFVIPDLIAAFGYWQLRTRGAQSSIPNIIGSFDMVKKYAGEEMFTRVPFHLNVAYAKSQHPGAVSKFPVISLTGILGFNELEKVKLLEETMSNIPGLITSTFLGQLKIEPPKQRLIAGGTE